MTDVMEIQKPELVQTDGLITYRARVRSPRGDNTLWYHVSDSHAHLVSDRTDAALVAMLLPAMARGEDIRIGGAISQRLFYNLSGPYQKIMQLVFPSFQRVKIHPDEVDAAVERPSGVATGFSAGIDSYCVLADHYYADTVPGFRVTHLLYNNVGSHGSGGESLFRERYARTRRVADRIGLPLVAVNSNVNDFYRGVGHFQATHTPRNASVALLLQAGIGRFLYASAYSYPDVFVKPTDAIAHCDPLTLPLLTTETLDAMAVGSEYTRVEKTRRVATVEDSFESLDVCMRNIAGNCSTCAKCMRTLLTLEIAGCLESYAGVFDIAAYKMNRGKYLTHVMGSGKPLEREIVAFARERGFRFPVSARLGATRWLGGVRSALQWMRPLPRRIASLVKRRLVSIKPLLRT